MKHIKLLFSISLLFTSITFSYAQTVIDGAKYFYLTYNTSNGKFNGSIENVIKSNAINNHYFFMNDTLIASGSKVYYNNITRKNLYYDFNLKLKDTFYFNRSTGIDTMIVDSLKSIKLDDGNIYKHLFMSSQYQSSPIIWVEGLGEKDLGWIRYDWQFTALPQLKAVCKNDNLVYWNNTFDGFDSFTIADTCDFNNLMRVSVSKLKYESINFFPNPAKDFITLEWKTNAKPAYVIVTDVQGKTIAQQAWKGNEKCNLITETWPNGMYFVRILTSENQLTIVRKVLINK